MDTPPENITRQLLDHRLRDAIRRDRETILAGQRPLPRGIPYDGRNLRWEDLGTLVADCLSRFGQPHWTPQAIEEALRDRIKSGKSRPDRALPWEKRERQAFIRALQEVMNYCYDLANDKRGSTLGPAENYYDFLGFEAISIQYHELGFDPSSIGFFRIVDWNYRRKLDERENIIGDNPGEIRKSRAPVDVSDIDLEQDWVDSDLLQCYLDEELGKPGSPCPSLAGYIEDTREQGSNRLHLMVRKSMYYKHVAIRRCLNDHPELYENIRSRVAGGGSRGGLGGVVARAPLSNIAINVTVLSRAGRLMVIKRPANTRTFSNSYQLGPHETMNWRESAGNSFETCFDLARRALREEVGIYDEVDYYRRIVFSWFGYYLPEASGYFFAHVQTRFTEDQLTEMVQASESRVESENVIWVEPTEEYAREVLSGWQRGPFQPDPSSQNGWIYLPHATLSITQLLRVMKERMLPQVQS